MAAIAKESDLYPLVRDHLAAQGFLVRGEVQGCDVVGVRDDDVVVVELKRALTLDLLAQAVRRTAVTDLVYVAIPRPPSSGADRRLREHLPVVRRLELGLLTVDLDREAVEVVVQPLPSPRRRQPRRRRAIITEVAARVVDTTGGTSKRPVVTAYRIDALRIATLLDEHGPLRPAELRSLGTTTRTLTILRGNVYGWFERVDRGIYALGPKGASGLATWADVVSALRAAAVDGRDHADATGAEPRRP